jgi:hypothetical protein
MTVKVEEGSGSKRKDKPKLLSKVIVLVKDKLSIFTWPRVPCCRFSMF